MSFVPSMMGSLWIGLSRGITGSDSCSKNSHRENRLKEDTRILLAWVQAGNGNATGKVTVEIEISSQTQK